MIDEPNIVIIPDHPMEGLRYSIIKFALYDYYLGEMVERWIRPEDLPENASEHKRKKYQRYASEALRNRDSAIKFIWSEWGDEVFGGINIAKTVTMLDDMIDEDSRLLSRPVGLYRVRGRGIIEPFRDFDRLRDVQIAIFPQMYNPSFILRFLQGDLRISRTFDFISHGKHYRGELR